MGGDQADGIEQSDVDRVSAKRCGDRTRAWKELEFNVEAGLLENAEIDAEKTLRRTPRRARRRCALLRLKRSAR